MDSKYEEAVKILRKNNQEHIIPIIEKFSEEKKEAIIEQILGLDFAELGKVYNQTKCCNCIGKIEPVKAIDPNEIDESKKTEYMEEGKKAISNNEFAVVIMAGGQGTRLRS